MLSLLRQPLTKLAARGRLTAALKTGHENNRRRLGRKVERVVALAHELAHIKNHDLWMGVVPTVAQVPSTTMVL